MSVSEIEKTTGLATMSSALPDAVNYHRWIVDLIRPHLSNRLLEIGFGYGQYTRELAPLVRQLMAVDLDPDCIALTDSLPENVELRTADIACGDFLERIGSTRFDSIVCLNVLEHIEDDVAALVNLHHVLGTDGRLLLLVPAHAALFGPMDTMAGHFRRYSRGMIQKRLETAGFQTEVLRYVNPLGGIGWWLNARFYRPSNLSDPTINQQILWFDRYVQPISRRLSRLTSLCFGQSVWVVARH